MQSPRILKADTVRGTGTRVAFNFHDLKRHGDDLLAEAHRHAESIRKRAELDAETLKAEAQATGRDAGFQRGLADAAAEIERRVAEQAEQIAAERLGSAVEAVQSIATTLGEERDRWLAEWEESAVRLSLKVAGKLTACSLQIDPEVARQRLRDLLDLAADRRQVVVKLHPDDWEKIQESEETLTDAVSRFGVAGVQCDASLSSGGCVLETRHGVIDGTIEAQLERIAEELTAK